MENDQTESDDVGAQSNLLSRNRDVNNQNDQTSFKSLCKPLLTKQNGKSSSTTTDLGPHQSLETEKFFGPSDIQENGIGNLITPLGSKDENFSLVAEEQDLDDNIIGESGKISLGGSNVGQDRGVSPLDDRSPTFLATPPSSGKRKYQRVGETHSHKPSIRSLYDKETSSPLDVLQPNSIPSIELEPTESPTSRLHDNPASETVQNSTSPITPFWILSRRHPKKRWALWLDADISQQSIQSIFDAVSKHSETSSPDMLSIILTTPEQDYWCKIPIGCTAYFEKMKKIMISVINECHESQEDGGVTTSVWIKPKSLHRRVRISGE